MRNFKRFLTLALAVVMVASVFTFGTSAATFTDVDEKNDTLVKAVNLLSHIGVTKGTSETTFGTEDLVTREQMAAFIYRLMKKGQSVEGGSNTSPFADLEDDTFFFMVSWANSQGIIKGTSATTFNPKGSITLQDGYTMIVRALGYEKEEALQYPFGFIETAEGEGVELNEGLREMSYTDALTRGDVAILLYNAFFAKTGVAETKEVEKEFSNGDPYLSMETTYPTFCEKYFDVLALDFQAIATPNYVFGASETTKDLGYDAVHFNYVGEDKDLGDCKTREFYADAADLGLENADDAIMSWFKIYVTLDADDEIDEILFADKLMNKVTTSDVKLETLAASNKKAHFGEDADNAKLLSGKVTFEGETAYFFNAPYSYVKPAYAKDATATEKYEARNDDNLKFIDFALLGDAKDGEYQYTVNNNHEDFKLAAGATVVPEYFATQAAKLVEYMPLAYVGGLYEADFYDVDGDEIFDYVSYKPYSFAFVDTDEKKSFAKNGVKVVDGVPTVYTEDAVIEGVEFEDEDLVIGIFAKDANYIKVAAVVEPVEATIEDMDADAGEIVLSTDATVSVKDGWKLVANYFNLADLVAAGYDVDEYNFTAFDNTLLGAGAYDVEDAEFFVYDGVVLYQDGVDATNEKVDLGSLIIVAPSEYKEGKTAKTWNTRVDEETMDDVNAVWAWIDGEEAWRIIETEDIEFTPALLKETDLANFSKKLSTYSVDANGKYTIKPLTYTEDAKTLGLATDVTLLAGKEEDDDVQVSLTVANAYLVKVFGSRLALKATDDINGAAADANADFDLVVGDDTKIIIRNEYVVDGDTKVKYYVYDASNPLTETIANELTNVQYVVENNIKSTSRENLVVLYGEVNGAKLRTGEESTGNERIVKSATIKKDAEGLYYRSYTVYNPYTGATETLAGTELVAKSTSLGTAYDKYAQGEVATLVGSNVDEETGYTKLGSVLANANLFWIKEYDAESDMIEIVAYGDENGTSYRLDVSDVAVTTIGAQTRTGTDMIAYGSMSVVDVAKLDGSDDALFAINDRFVPADADEDADFETVYGKYLKAYIAADWEDDTDKTVADDKTGFNGEANFIVLVANNKEDKANCDLSDYE